MKIEFFTGSDGQVWYRSDGRCLAFTQKDAETIEYILDRVRKAFPRAFERLREISQASARNIPYHKYKMVERFIRCNLGDDNMQALDIDNDKINLETVQCPLRGICKDEGVVCKPKPASALSEAEYEVAVMYSKGWTIEQISALLQKSLSTVNNQLWNIKNRFNLKSRHEVIKLCNDYYLL